MGLLSRLKNKSKDKDPVASSSSPTSPNPDPTSPTSSARPKFGTVSSRRSGLGPLGLSSRSQRPELSPSAASSRSIASRWKERRRSKTRDELVVGPIYDGSPNGKNGSAPTEGGSGPTSDDLHHTTSRLSDANLPPSPIKSKTRPASMEYKQEGGVLGRLNFESILEGKPRQDDGDQLQSWLGEGNSTEQSPKDSEALIFVDKDDAQPRSSEEVEVLESMEKKSKFWKGKGRIRRMSKARSEIEDDLPPADGSPTPRRVSLPPVDALPEVKPAPSTELHHPRPQTLRRPSSSFFHNTFVRSMSRTSMAHDIEVPISTEDDGSFQLKGFRHVSGTAEVDVFNQYSIPGTLSADQSASPVSPTRVAHGSSLEKTTTPSIPPPSAYYSALPRPRMPSSRPPSVAGSTTSLDEMMTASPKITAAAFRRGVRRQSENVMVPMDPRTKAANDDDDDLPLAMTRRRRMSVVSMPVETFDASPTVPLSLKPAEPILQPEVKCDDPEVEPEPKAPQLDTSPSANTSRTSSLSPSPSLNVLKRNDKPVPTGRGFAVKSATSTRQERHGDISRGQSWSRPPAFDSPVSTKPSTPVPVDEPEILLSPMDIHEIEKTLAPPLISPNDKRAQPQDVLYRAVGRTPSPLQDRKETVPSRSPPTPPPVASLVLPEPGDTTPSSTELPLPPDQMPATPPPLSKLPSRPPSQTQSPRQRKASLGILEEPLRVISAFWAASPPDPSSPGKTPRRGSQPVAQMAGPSFTPRQKDIILRPRSVPLQSSSPVKSTKDVDDELELWAFSSQHLLSDDSDDERVPRRMTLFDASAATTPSLRDKKSASSMKMIKDQRGPTSRTSLSSINTNIDRPGHTGPSTAPLSGATPLAISFRGGPHGAKTAQRGKAAWSSSESDSDPETESPSPRSPARIKDSVRRVPAGPRNAGSTPSSPEKARKASRRVSGPRPPRRASVASAQRRKVRSKSSSRDEKLSTLRERVSSSRMPQDRVSPAKSTATLPTSPRRQISSSAAGLSGSPPQSSSSGHPGFPPGGAVRLTSQTGQSQAQVGHVPGRPTFHRTATSPNSSRSGRTSESFAQQLVTPRSGDYSGDLEQGGYTDTEPRQRRLSTASSHWSSVTPPALHPGMDPNLMRTAMKQAWQAQFMAAAYRASEEEWERASSVGGDHPASPLPPPPGFPQMPFGLPPPPMPYGYPLPYHPPTPQPFQYQYPPMDMIPPYPHPPPHAQPLPPFSPPVDMVGFQFTHGSQSVFGGDFGPPMHHRPDLPQSTGSFGQTQYYTHPTDRTDRAHEVKSVMGSRGEFEEAETPRRTRRSSTLQYAN